MIVIPPAIVFENRAWVEDKTEHKWIPLSRWFRAVYLYGETLACNRVFTKRDSTRSGKSACNHYVFVSMGI